MHQPIAVMDSGVGGLTVVKEIMRQLPLENIIYFGDSERSPYGSKSLDIVKKYVFQIVDFLLQYNPKMIVIACNTATAAALNEISSYVDVPVIGVIEPGARAAIKATRNHKIGIIGTEGTIQSGAYESALRQISPQVEAIAQACPRFAPLVESGLFEQQTTYDVVSDSLYCLKEDKIDSLILGCTHYPYLQDTIQKVMGHSVELINSAEETAREISTILSHRGQLNQIKFQQKHVFLCSGDAAIFSNIASRWLCEQIKVHAVSWRGIETVMNQ
ncbi:glutamate racemase [Longirhabdus pacifica]|uniref:glutamate racemase n=1 Tax=Longirhabdus pacifica TaxID=2305227 RepID=UPI0010088334|nr:glutamate racemase [Longirhabdus pacifica]